MNPWTLIHRFVLFLWNDHPAIITQQYKAEFIRALWCTSYLTEFKCSPTPSSALALQGLTSWEAPKCPSACHHDTDYWYGLCSWLSCLFDWLSSDLFNPHKTAAVWMTQGTVEQEKKPQEVSCFWEASGIRNYSWFKNVLCSFTLLTLLHTCSHGGHSQPSYRCSLIYRIRRTLSSHWTLRQNNQPRITFRKRMSHINRHTGTTRSFQRVNTFRCECCQNI